jgi:hypothetical protein
MSTSSFFSQPLDLQSRTHKHHDDAMFLEIATSSSGLLAPVDLTAGSSAGATSLIPLLSPPTASPSNGAAPQGASKVSSSFTRREFDTPSQTSRPCRRPCWPTSPWGTTTDSLRHRPTRRLMFNRCPPRIPSTALPAYRPNVALPPQAPVR